MDHIKIEILGAESIGVRSMCCKIETPDVAFLLDPGCSLGPRPLHEIPHPLEYKRLHEVTDRILDCAKNVSRFFISHYHHDHFKPRMIDELYIHTSNPLTKELYKNKELYLKSQRSHIGHNQQARCRYFKQSVSRLATNIHDADFQRFTFGDTIVDFSHPVPHGEAGTNLGYVIMVRIRWKNEGFIFAPDVQGPVVEDSVKFLLDTPVDAMFIGGAPYYLEESLRSFPFNTAGQFLLKLHSRIPTIILDHHCCRDMEKYNALLKRIKNEANAKSLPRDHDIINAATFMKKEPAFLESKRKDLYEKQPPSSDFMKWMKADPGKRNQTQPPLD